jgi:NAD(P) transhydrogenase subunit alpha
MIFVGIEVIGHVPSVLHTPLMSGANAIHGVVIIGAIIVMGKAEPDNYLALILGFLGVILGTLNVVGGFVVTDRMLEMFSKKKIICRMLEAGCWMLYFHPSSNIHHPNKILNHGITYNTLLNRFYYLYFRIKNALESQNC